MPLPSSKKLLGAALGAALLAGVVAAPTIAHASTRSTAEGLLVFAVEHPAQNTEWFSIGGARTPFGGDQYDSLENATDGAQEFDLSHFDDDGRIKVKEVNTCLGVDPATPVRAARAVAQGCDAANPNQEWRVDHDNGDRLRNIGTGLYVESMTPFSGWSMTEDVTKSPYRMLLDYIDGRPVVFPKLSTEYDADTDTFTLSGKGGPSNALVTVIGEDGARQSFDPSDEFGSFSFELPHQFGDLEHIQVAVGRDPEQVLQLRLGAVHEPRLVNRPDGSVAFYGEAPAGYIIHIGTGPLASDIIAVEQVGTSGLVEIPLPTAEPGDTFVVYIGMSGVRTSVTVPALKEYLTAVDGPDTLLDRTKPTPVPFGLRAQDDVARVTSTLTLTAPAGTRFTPTQSLDGEEKPVGGTWSGADPALSADGVDITADGRTLTASISVGGPDATGLHSGDELRWWAALEVVDPAAAPTHV